MTVLTNLSMSLVERYAANTQASALAFERMSQAMPGGTNRGLIAHAPYPFTIDRGEGPYLWDVDGNRYIDCIGNMFALVHGNAFPPVVEAVREQLERGSAFAANNLPQLELAEIIKSRLDSIDKIIFCNSGLEAFSYALNAARAYTGKMKFLMAPGGYHGMLYDTLQAGKGIEGAHSLVAPYGDADKFVEVIERHAEELCAVYLEGVMGSASLTTAPLAFFETVYAACRRHGVLFVLDEVVTLRLSAGGFQSRLNFKPDLTMMGKIIGGGFPVGAVGGREDVMAVFDPVGGKAQASGTFSANPVTMRAGIATLEHLTPEVIEEMDRLTIRLVAGIERAARDVSLPLWIRRAGSMVSWHFYDPGEAVVIQADRPDREMLSKHHLALLVNGISALPRACLVVSSVMTEDLIDEIVVAFSRSLADIVATV